MVYSDWHCLSSGVFPLGMILEATGWLLNTATSACWTGQIDTCRHSVTVGVTRYGNISEPVFPVASALLVN